MSQEEIERLTQDYIRARTEWERTQRELTRAKANLKTAEHKRDGLNLKLRGNFVPLDATNYAKSIKQAEAARVAYDAAVLADQEAATEEQAALTAFVGVTPAE